MSKHDWNSLQHYLEIHEKTLRMYHSYMETSRVYSYEKVTPYHHELNGERIYFQTYRGTRIRVDIRKVIEVDLSNPKRPRAKTFRYSYNANIPGGKELIRYCSPHDEDEREGTAPHHRYHHKHDFTVDPKNEITVLGNDEWPHVGEFLEEVLGRF